jgi:Rhodopirellula transposase DDE domain
MGYGLQANNKTREGSKLIDREAQFQYITTQAIAFLTANEPVISSPPHRKNSPRRQ